MVTASPDAQPAPVQKSIIAALAADYQGNVTGGAIASMGGTIREFTAANSTLQVNPDCTGTWHLGVVLKGSTQPLPVQDIYQFVVLNNGDELVMLETQGLTGPPIAIGHLRRTDMMPVTPAW